MTEPVWEDNRTWAEVVQEQATTIRQLKGELASRPFEITGDQLTDDMLVMVKKRGDWFEAGEWIPASNLIGGIKEGEPTRPVADSLRRLLVKRQTKTIAQILVDHQRMDCSGCLCGWTELGASHSGHIESVLREAGKLVEE